MRALAVSVAAYLAVFLPGVWWGTRRGARATATLVRAHALATADLARRLAATEHAAVRARRAAHAAGLAQGRAERWADPAGDLTVHARQHRDGGGP